MVDINVRPRLKAASVLASAGKWRIRDKPLLYFKKFLFNTIISDTSIMAVKYKMLNAFYIVSSFQR